MESETRHPFQKLIRERRESLNLSQEQLAQRIKEGAHGISIHRAETGKRLPSAAYAREIVSALNAIKPFNARERQQLASLFLLPPALQSTSEIIGVSVPRLGDSALWGAIVGELESQAHLSAYRIVVCQHDEDVSIQCAHLDRFINRIGVAGVIMAPAVGIAEARADHQRDLENAVGRLIDANIPAVYIGRRLSAKPMVPYIGLDNDSAGSAVAAQLLKENHSRIGALMSLKNSSSQRERLEGFRRTLQKKQPFDEGLVRWGVEVQRETRHAQRKQDGIRAGYKNALDLLRRPSDQRPTAIMCGAYYMAIEALRAVHTLSEEGTTIRIPEDLSLVAFDTVRDLDTPQLRIARIEYSIDSLAKEAVHTLVSLIHSPNAEETPGDTLLTPNYFRGESVTTAPLRQVMLA